MMVTEFVDADIPVDSVPMLDDVEYPCDVCGNESGPYGGRGPKPKKCTEHKKKSVAKTSSIKVNGASNNLAARAATALCSINGMLAFGAMCLGLVETGMSIQAAQESFKENAYQALLTDEDLCRSILKSGGKSAKLSLGLAYFTMGMTVVPAAIMELKAKKLERDSMVESD